MNSDELKGKWKQLKGTIKVEWAKLTDNDLDAIDGRKDILVGKLQEHYGMTTEAAEGAIDAWVNKSVEPTALQSIWSHVEGNWMSLVGLLEEQYGKLSRNELMESKGERDSLAGLFQRHYGVSLSEAYKMTDDWADKALEKSHAAGGK